jgi:hypothetical protein
MRIVPAIEAEIRREIRDARAIDPLISVSSLEETLEKKFQRGFSYRYIAKLADKVARQALIEADRTQIEERLAFTRENYRIIRERLMKIVNWKTGDDGHGPWHSEVTEAAKAIVAMDLAILKAEIENGLYKRPIEVLQKEFQYEPLPPEVRVVIIAAWTRGGLLPRAAIEQMVPQQLPNAPIVLQQSH